MAEVLRILAEPVFVVHPTSGMRMDGEQFFEFCQANQDLRIERTAAGDIMLLAPRDGSSGRGNMALAQLFETWAQGEGRGTVFGSATGFTLPNGAMRAPDIAWVRNERLEALTDEEFLRFLPLCPDFVLELRSPSDSLRVIQQKMEEYIANGAELGWLIDPFSKSVIVYRPEGVPEVLERPASVSGEPVLAGFSLDVPRLWAAMERKRTRH